ncbi:hypothetical protein DFS34DRAFT_635538 [Phlyctochytrium arcticum]|nr:hypothetical protein DFS34DRAFT_635538 [Phlyctochytrium arcticum]
MAAVLQPPLQPTIALSLKHAHRLPNLPNQADLSTVWRSIENDHRHSNCINPSESPLNANDVSATPYITCSKGPVRDPRHFYSTAYSTTHNTNYHASNSRLMKSSYGGTAGGARKADSGMYIPALMRKTGTGYSKNVVPYVEYDKQVDEGPEFNIPEPFGTTYGKFFVPPKETTAHAHDLSSLTDTGFTRMPPKYNITKDGSTFRDMHSTMKTSYDPERLVYKGSRFDRSCIAPSDSAYTTDRGHLESFGNGTDTDWIELPKKLPIAERDWKDYNTTRMDEDGYTRSYHGNILSDNTNEGKKCPEHDPDSWTSTTRLVHRNLQPSSNKYLSGQIRDLKIGYKEPQGSVRNNPVYLGDPVLDPRIRFNTETCERYTAPHQTIIPPIPRLDGTSEKPTGFTRGNKFEYNLDVLNEEAMRGHLHPMQACARRTGDRGLDALKPNQVKFGGTKASCNCGCKG